MVNLLADFGASQDDLPAHEDEEHNLGLHHSVDETREELRLIRREMVMTGSKTFETDWELDVARTHDVLNLEIWYEVSRQCHSVQASKLPTGELGVEAQFLDDTSIFAA